MRKPGVKAIVCRKGKILLILRDNDPTIAYPNKWNLPGGGIEDGEAPETAMRRELDEEINLKDLQLTYVGTTSYSEGSLVYRFFCEVTDEQFASIKLVSEGQRLGWFTPDEVMAMIKENAYSPYLAVYFEKFIEPIRLFLGGKHDIEPMDTRLEVLI